MGAKVSAPVVHVIGEEDAMENTVTVVREMDVLCRTFWLFLQNNWHNQNWREKKYLLVAIHVIKLDISDVNDVMQLEISSTTRNVSFWKYFFYLHKKIFFYLHKKIFKFLNLKKCVKAQYKNHIESFFHESTRLPEELIKKGF